MAYNTPKFTISGENIVIIFEVVDYCYYWCWRVVTDTGETIPSAKPLGFGPYHLQEAKAKEK